MRRWIALGATCTVACFEETPDGVDPQSTTGGTSVGGSETSSSSSVTTTSSDGSESTSHAPDTSSGGAPVCGDGMPEGDEVCDDGNDVPADGCTGCRPSLTTEWVRPFGTDLDGEVAAALSGRTDQIVAAGMLGGDMGDGDLWIEVLDESGASMQRVLSGGMAGVNDAVIDVRVAVDGAIWTTGTVSDDAVALSQVDSRRYSPTFELDWVAKHGGDDVIDTGTGLGLLVPGSVVGATLGNAFVSDAWFARYSLNGTVEDELFCDCGPFGGVMDLATGVAGARAAVSTEQGRQLWGFDGTLMAGPSWDADLSVTSDQPWLAIDVGAGGDTVVCSGRSGGNDVNVWVARFDSNGNELWTATHDLGDGDQACLDVVVGPSDILLAGMLREDATNARGLVARLETGTGDLLHSQELEIEGSDDTRVAAIDLVGGIPYIAGAFAMDDFDDDAFVARLVP